MAILFFGVNGPTLDLREDLQIADTDAPRIMAYLMASSFGTVTENVITDIPDQNWTPAPEQPESDRPMIFDPDWVADEGQTEDDRPLIPDATWTPTPAQTEADRPTTQQQSWVSRPATPEETAEAYARSVLASLLDATVAFEKAQAAQAAANAVAPIVPV
jgi:hypothetical protein